MTEVLARRAVYALIDRNARKGQKPSDHTPVFVDLDIDIGGNLPGQVPQP